MRNFVKFRFLRKKVLNFISQKYLVFLTLFKCLKYKEYKSSLTAGMAQCSPLNGFIAKPLALYIQKHFPQGRCPKFVHSALSRTLCSKFGLHPKFVHPALSRTLYHQLDYAVFIQGRHKKSFFQWKVHLGLYPPLASVQLSKELKQKIQ